MKGQLLYPPQPSATVHTLLCVWDTDSVLLPCSGCLAKPLPEKQGAGPGKKKSYTDRKIHTLEGYCIALVGGEEWEGGGAMQG